MTEKLNNNDCFLVCDNSLSQFQHTPNFIKWLESQGFKSTSYSGNWGCNWVFINVYNKLYALGRPGVAYAKVVCNHAITIDEFKTIYKIYKKYDGKDLFVFNKERFDYDKTK